MGSETEIVRACRLAGGQSELARKLCKAGTKVTPQAVYKWVKKGETPPDKASIIEQLFPGSINSRKLCPGFPWPTAQHLRPTKNEPKELQNKALRGIRSLHKGLKALNRKAAA